MAEIERKKQVEAAAAKVIWETSRRDEGTISATGANIVARALGDAGLLTDPAESGNGPIVESSAHNTRRLKS